MARAAINILGATGKVYDFVPPNLADSVKVNRESVGVYVLLGTFGMVPFPPEGEGWGYTLNQVDAKADIDIAYADGELRVVSTKSGKPYDLKHMITLHILVSDPVVPPIPEEFLNV